MFRVNYHLILIIVQNKVIQDPQLQTCPGYDTREMFFIRGVTNDTSDYEYERIITQYYSII